MQLNSVQKLNFNGQKYSLTDSREIEREKKNG